METDLQRYKADFFKAMAHPQRLALLERLVEGPGTVSELAEQVGLEVPAASRHLAQLKQAGVLDSWREGSTTNYRLSTPLVGELLRVSRAILQERLNNAEAMLADLRGS